MSNNQISALPLRFQYFGFSDSVLTNEIQIDELFCPFVSKCHDESFSANDFKSYFDLSSSELEQLVESLLSQGVIEPRSKLLTLEAWEEAAEARKRETFTNSIANSDGFEFSEEEEEEEEVEEEVSFDID